MIAKHQWIQTFGPAAFVYGNRKASTGITVEAIAHALSRIPRFGGHTVRRWTGAQHTLHVYDLAKKLLEANAYRPSPEFVRAVKLHALLHDAHEAFMGGDMPSPLIRYILAKWHFNLNVLKDEIDEMIYANFSLPRPSLDVLSIVKHADAVALTLERRRFMPSQLAWETDDTPIPDCCRHVAMRLGAPTGARTELIRLLTNLIGEA